MTISFETILPYAMPLRPDMARLGAGGAVPAEPGDDPVSVDRLDANEAPYDLPLPLKRRLAARIAQTACQRYPDDSHVALRRALASYVARSAGLPCGALQEDAIIVSGGGSVEFVRNAVVASCVGTDGAVLTFTPTFAMYDVCARTLGVPVVEIPRDPESDAIDFAAAQRAIEQRSHGPIRVVFVAHPNAPTGVPLTDPEIEWLRSLPESVLVVVDEAYFEYSGRTLVAEALERRNWMVLRTFSKGLRLASFRVGYAVTSPRLRAAMERVRLPFSVPAASQEAALLVLEHLDQILPATAEVVAERHRLAHQLRCLRALRVWSSATNYLFVTLRTSSPTLLSALHRALLERGTIVKLTAGGLRISVGRHDQNRRTQRNVLAAMIDLGLA